MGDIDYTINYERWHNATPEHAQAMEDYFLKSLREFLPRDRSAPILEVGCATGYALSALGKAGYANVEGMDADAGQIREARRRGLKAEHVPLDAFDAFVRARAGRYALVFAFDVIEHVPISEQLRFVRGMREMLRDGGDFVCQVPNALSPVASYMRYNDWTHHASFTEDSLGFLMLNAGLSPVCVRASHDPSPRRHPLAQLAVGAVKSCFRLAVRGWWRLVLYSEVGARLAKTHPVSPNILMLSRKAEP